MKVCFIIDSLQAGGKERQLVELLKGISIEKDIKAVLILLSENFHFKEIFNLSVEIKFLSCKSKKKITIFYELFNICKKLKPNIIHSWGAMASLYVLPTAKLLGIKWVNGSIRYAVPVKPFSKLWIVSKFILRFANVNVTNSSAGLKSHHLKPSEKNYCIYNGFDFSRLKNISCSDEIKKIFSIKTKFVVGMVANFLDSKDYQTYLNAAGSVLEKRKDVTFLCVGSGPKLEKMRQTINSKFVDFIKFLGHRPDVESIINTFNIGILCSNTKGHAEGISNSIMEYMALGKPVIATDSGGNKEIVVDNETGYIINPFAVDELTEKIHLLLNDTKKRREMGEAGRERIINEFDSQKMANRYLDLYKKILK